MGIQSAAKTSDKRERILDAAELVFAKSGFFHARVAEIAKTAGVADGTIYLYFKSKDEVLTSIFEAALERLSTGARTVLADIDDPREQLRVLARYHVANVRENRAVAAVLLLELRLSSRFLKDFSPRPLQEYLDVIGAVLKRGQEQGVFRPHDSRLVRKAFFGALDELALEWILNDQPKHSIEESTAEVAEVFVTGLVQNPTRAATAQAAAQE